MTEKRKTPRNGYTPKKGRPTPKQVKGHIRRPKAEA